MHSPAISDDTRLGVLSKTLAAYERVYPWAIVVSSLLRAKPSNVRLPLLTYRREYAHLSTVLQFDTRARISQSMLIILDLFCRALPILSIIAPWLLVIIEHSWVLSSLHSDSDSRGCSPTAACLIACGTRILALRPQGQVPIAPPHRHDASEALTAPRDSTHATYRLPRNVASLAVTENITRVRTDVLY